MGIAAGKAREVRGENRPEGLFKDSLPCPTWTWPGPGRLIQRPIVRLGRASPGSRASGGPQDLG